MKRKFTFLIAAAFMLLTMMATTGRMWGQSDYSTTYTSGVTLSTTGGTSASTCKVIVSGNTQYDGIKAGTSSAAGAMKITVPSGTKYLHIHVAAWNGESVTLSVTPNSNISPSSISLTADGGIKSNSPFTLATPANAPTNYYKVITFTNALTANTELTFTATSGKRFVIWGVNAEEASSNPSISADDVEIAYNATSGSIVYEIENGEGNVTASITTAGDWLTSLGTITASEVPFNCSANNTAAPRTATVTLSFTGATDKVVTITQAGNPNVVNNISDITAAGNYTVKGTIVAMSTRGFVLGDGTGYVYYYYGNNFSTTYTIGDIVKLSGAVTASDSYKVFQFTSSATITAATESNYVAEDPTVISGADMDAQVASTATVSLSNYIQYQGTLTVNNTFYNITSIDGATTAKGSISYPTNTDFTSLNGKVVTVTGYFVGVSSSQYYNTMIGSIEEAVVPSITLQQYTYNLNADGGNAELPVTYTNMPADPQAVVIFYEANGETPLTENPTWITAEINDNYNIAGHIDVNEGEARSAYFKVRGKDTNNNYVYSNLVTINQAAAGPHIEFNTTSYNLAVGGESKTISFDYSGLGSTPEFTVRFYDATGETQTTYGWISGEITQGDKVTITVDPNTGEARTAYFKVYGENGNVNTESNLVTITQAAYVVDYATLPFSWAGNTSAPTGITNNGVGTYTSSPYLKFDGTGDYIILKINERPGVLSFDIKGNGFSSGSTSTFKVQTSTDGTNYADLATYTELGETSNKVFDNLGAEVRYIKWIYTEKGATSGGNVALGNIALAVYDNTPSITAEDVNIAHDATGGSITYTINNPVEGGTMGSMPISGGDWLTVGGPSNGSVALTCEQNTGAERTATVRLTYTYNNTKEVVTKDVTVTQAGVPATMYIVNFNLDDGTFVPNDDFPQDVVEKEAGTYTLPSATKAGYDFTGWNDGNATYAAGDEYTVLADVDFTAQWTESTTGTIAFGSNNIKINAAEVSGDDSMGNTWTITTEGTSSFTQNAAYSQVGSGSSPATSITFTMTLPQQKIISAFEAKFGGFNGTVGDIALTVGNTAVGSGSLNGSTDVIVEATTTTEVGTVLTVTVTNIDKGVKCYYISYTLSDAPVVPVIDATAGSALAYNATAGSIIYEIANYEAGTMTATTTADWINALVVTTPTAEDGEVTFNVTNNTSNESRSATVTLTFTYGDPAATVTKDVTVTQNGQPSITVSPATANVAFAGGTPEFAVTYESLEITKADDFDVEFYETSTSTIAGNQPSWITNVAITGNTTDGFTLTVTVAANDGDARDAYLKVYAAGSNVYIYSNLVTINQAAFVQLTTYSLVTSVDQIVSGKHYLIASGSENGTAYAMGNQNENNRSGVAITIDNSQITETEGVYEFVINTHLNNNDEVEYYTIYDAVTPGYLYAASSSKNYLKTSTTLDDNGKWTIAINNNSATITAQGTNSRKLMRYNPNNNSPIFACYAEGSTTGNAPCLYVKNNDNDYEYYGMELTYNDYAIPANETITIGAGSVLTVNGSLTNTTTDNLIIEDGGQLIHTSDVQATVQKNVAASPTWGGKGVSGWYTIASPVNDLKIDCATTGNYDFFKYDEETYTWLNQKVTAHHITNFEQGVGYLYANSAATVIDYLGTLIGTGTTVTKPLSYVCENNSYKGINLMGNPFSCNIVNGKLIISDGDETTDVTTYYSVEGGDELAVHNLADTPIKPGQGFLVQASGDGQNLVFNPTSKDRDAAKIGYISIAAGNSESTDNAFVQIGGGNTLHKMTLSDNSSIVYVKNNNDNYASARINALEGSMPVCFKANKLGTFTITIEAKDIDVEYLHLIDNFTYEDIDLLLEPSYSFIASNSDNAARFTLVFRANGCEGTTNDIFAYQNGSDIIVNGEGELQVFDVTGRMVLNQHMNGIQAVNIPSQGVFIFKLNEKTQKIVVR